MVSGGNSTGINAAPIPPSKQPPAKAGVITWLRKNIFNGVINSLLSLILMTLIVTVVSNIFEWAVLNGVWNAESAAECRETIIATA